MSANPAAGEPIISVSGLRGIVGRTLTPEVAVRYVTALADLAPPGALVIAGDGRPSGRMLADAIHAALGALGRDSIDAGVAATPTTGVLIRHFRAAGGVQITASHNPAQYNGLKLFDAAGRVIPDRFGQRVLARYRAGAGDRPATDPPGTLERCRDPLSAHLEAVLATVDVDRIRRRQFNVLLDSNHGAGSLLGRRLLEELGCGVTLLGGTPDGQFEHTPEPLAENLVTVCPAVVRAGADVGFCQDPDADRLAVIDASGRYLGEEYTLAMCVDHVLRARKGPIVTNCSTSRMAEDLAGKYGVPFSRSAVGEANVVDVMLAHEAVFGGEGNGGPIDPAVGLVRDSFVGMAQLLDAMAGREMPIGELADELPRYAIVKTKIPMPPEEVAAGLDALADHFADAQPDRLDGLRLDWPDRWLLVRPSNTEPIVRAVAEATTEAQSRGLCDEAAAVIGR
ncbi:MAG TPA: phosphoglucosamine mutase [Thermoguttaceae bacterium]|nr:phosphoglucosamine mutase [Thermoguttaceae bacterium]